MAIKPDTQHPQYAAALTRWQACRDVIEGEDAVHRAGEKYLPKLSGQDSGEYKDYVKRTPFYNATARTVDGLVGMLFRKDPVVTVPDAMAPLTDDMTLAGCDFNELAEIVAREVIDVGRVGLLVDYPTVGQSNITKAQADAQNLRPYATIYKAEAILNWKVQRINNAMRAVMITLAETVTVWESEFESKAIQQIRALLLSEGKYIQRLYRKNEKGDEWVQFEGDIVPLKNNAPLTDIPFLIFGPSHNDWDVQKPPIYDLVTLNLSHYRTSADLEHGAHFTGLPTPVVTGYHAQSGEKLAIGSAAAWVFPDPNAKATYLEFTGQGLEALENRLKAKEAGMAAIGARMLAPEKASVEATKTVQLRHNGEGAVLGTIGDMIEHGFEKLLMIMAEWSGVAGEIDVELNEDFVDIIMGAQDVLALVQAWQAGAMSFETLFWNLQQGDLVGEERTVEDEQKAIGKGPKPVAAAATNAE